MVENIVERVAKAICNAPWHVGTGHEICADMARAAILEALQAFNEPTDEFLEQIHVRAYDGRFSKSRETYPVYRNFIRSFVDAAIKEMEEAG